MQKTKKVTRSFDARKEFLVLINSFLQIKHSVDLTAINSNGDSGILDWNESYCRLYLIFIPGLQGA